MRGFLSTPYKRGQKKDLPLLDTSPSAQGQDDIRENGKKGKTFLFLF